MDDRELEALLESELSALPPSEDVVRDVTPWRKAFNRILWGMGLTTITLNFLGLNMLLPAIGNVLTLLGYRALRQENSSFRGCYWISIVHVIHTLLWRVLDATVWAAALAETAVVQAAGTMMIGLQIVQYLLLWSGIRSLQRRSGLEPHAGSALAIAAYQVLLLMLALLGVEGILILAAAVVYCFILRSLYRLSKELDTAGYAVEPAPTRFSDRTVAITLAVTAALGIAVGCVCFQQYSMDWQPASETSSGEADEVRADLLALGFPEDVLDDLTNEDVLACQSALDVYSEDNNFMPYPDGFPIEQYNTTVVAVLLPEQHIRYYFSFRWDDAAELRGTDAVSIQTRTGYETLMSGSISGAVMYEKDGVTYRAPYAEVSHGNGICSGGFSLPDGENRRGYLTCEVYLHLDTTTLIADNFTYYHKNPGWPALYPFSPAIDTAEIGLTLFGPNDYLDVTAYFLFRYNSDGTLSDTGS